MKYLKGVRRPEGQHLWAVHQGEEGIEAKCDRSPIRSNRSLTSNARCALKLEFATRCNDRCALLLEFEAEALSVGSCCWWLMRFFFFRLGLFLISVFALLDESADAYIGLWFFFFFWESIGLLYHLLFFFFRLGLLYHLLFRIDVGLFI